jgi:hypothetical protein
MRSSMAPLRRASRRTSSALNGFDDAMHHFEDAASGERGAPGLNACCRMSAPSSQASTR